MNETWEIIRDLVLPHIGRLIFNTIGFGTLGLLISVLLLIIMFRKKVLTRSNTAYKIIIRIIYIPFIIFFSVYCFGHIGFVRGVYKVMSAETPHLVEGIYSITVNQLFSNNEEKKKFLEDVKSTLAGARESKVELSAMLEQEVTEQMFKKTGSGFVNRIVKRYKTEIYTAVLSGLFYAADMKYDTNMKYAQLCQALDRLDAVQVEKIEGSVKASLVERVQKIIDKHYRSAWISGSLFWLIAMCIPFLEFLIYKKLIEKPAPSL